MTLISRIAASVTALLASATPLTASAQGAPAAREVLPDSVVPSHYDIALVPDIAGKTFTGTVGIDLTVRATTSAIVLNAQDLTFDAVTLDSGTPGTASFDKARGQATIAFAARVRPGAHRLTIRYHAAVRSTTLGLFAMDYTSPAGPRRTIATNLEPAMARTVFPGWDQPASKATFTLTLDVPSDRMAVANMPVARTTALSPALNRVTFAQSPKMSTYLFFFGIGDWERIHAMVDGVDVGVVVAKGDGAKGRYALEEARKLLAWYNQYFGVPYPLPKLDLVVAPGSIEGGAMENWGAIFYSQRALLFDPAISTDRDRQQVFLVVAHEMAHQWFGDLVTMGWWDDLWLNEGFARWMQTYAADALHPEWRTGLQAQTIFADGKSVDALPSTHPVVQPVLTANQAGQAFDQITYDKGAAVITMLKGVIGDAPFREGVRRYMRTHAYGNTADSDLWQTMQAVTGKPIVGIERDFTRQPGVPLIRVSETPGGMTLTEDRFYAIGPDGAAPNTTVWRIPLAIAAPGLAPQTVQLSAPRTVPAPRGTLINAGQLAYAHVLYPQPAFEALLQRAPTLAPVDQIGLLQGANALGLAGYAPLSNTLALAARLQANAESVVWQSALTQLYDLDQAYGDAPGRTAFRAWARGLLAAPLADLGNTAVAGEPVNRAILRTRLQRAMGVFGDPATIAQARALLASGGGTPSEADTALRIVAASADTAQFDALVAKARAEQDPLRKERIYQALAGVEDAALASRVIGLANSDEVPAGTGISLLGPIAGNHPRIALDEIMPLLGSPKLGLSPNVQRMMAAAVFSAQSDSAAAAAAARYLATVPEDSRAPFRGIDATIRHNAQIRTVVLPEVNEWIAAHPRPR